MEPPAVPAAVEEERRPVSDDTAKVVKAILRRRGGGWLNGRPLLALDRLVEQHGVALVLEALAFVPVELSPPLVVDQVAVELASIGDDDPAVDGFGTARELVELDHRHAAARQLCAMYEEDLERCAADPEHWATYQSARAEVLECENRRSELHDAMRVRA